MATKPEIPEEQGLRGSQIQERRNLCFKLADFERRYQDAQARYEQELDTGWGRTAIQLKRQMAEAIAKLDQFDNARRREAEMRASDETQKLNKEVTALAERFETELAAFCKTLRTLQDTALKRSQTAGLRFGEPQHHNVLDEKIRYRVIERLGSLAGLELEHYDRSVPSDPLNEKV